MKLDDIELNSYKLSRGENYDERVEDLISLIEDEIGNIEVVGEEERSLEGGDATIHKLDTDIYGIESIFVGPVRFSNKKTQFLFGVRKQPLREVEDLGRMGEELLEAKNNVLETVTGRDAEQRKKSMKN